MAPPVQEPQGRFWKRVEKTSTCWFWTGPFFDDGYGAFQLNGQARRAHRISYAWTNGDIPVGYVVCHHCDEPRCVRPDHLFAGTPNDNNQDKIRKGRAPTPEQMKRALAPLTEIGMFRGENNQAAKLTEQDVIEIRRLRVEGVPPKKLSERFQVSRNTILRVLNGEHWKHLPNTATVKYEGLNHHCSKLTPSQVQEIRSLHKDGWSTRKLAAKFGNSASAIGQLLRGRTYTEVV